MAKQKTPEVEKVVDSVMKYVEETINFIKKTIPSPKTAAEVTAVEDAINAKFETLSPQEQAHMLFFAIMIVTKLARLEPKSGRIFSNPILMAQTFMVVMNKAVSKMNMDIVDIAFSVEAEPVYALKDGDIDKMLVDIQKFNLENIDPQGNA